MYKLKLITRYLIKRRITHFAVLAVTLCVFIVVVVMTVMNGLVGGFKQKNHEFVGDCVVGTKSLVGFVYYEEFMDILWPKILDLFRLIVLPFGLKFRFDIGIAANCHDHFGCAAIFRIFPPFSESLRQFVAQPTQEFIHKHIRTVKAEQDRSICVCIVFEFNRIDKSLEEQVKLSIGVMGHFTVS